MNKTITLILALLLGTASNAQTNIDLGGISADPKAPIEVSADNLSVDQDSGTAVFSGNVVIGQGDLRLSAGSVRVVYSDSTGDIAQLLATDGVTLVTDSEAAEAATADYNLTTGILTLSGSVLLTQGASALSAEQMTIDLNSGRAQMSGRVRTVFQQDGNN
ncbi:MAG: lipopolysaccharide transport periplasmic protein LptA [Loktanella sp.]|jgi:lipopolysaccharide export system protein LptA|nr:lipopolysaccharide transport periplasmic protein LptA [Loktanella sp.]MDO7627278.1 lipopolysaccharide transport periplasmic protein LptA [Loktanella sp.]MDO7685669.1 lipopolysaccharide transport periplasmic protein LptA [Loktanella sp.]MDO7706768.1 lipopolysaccharide transport periplasmic protein LptA [Loktanella sp.]MDO7725005.1 lipopolysaccharide transport periplasmic protein LptA [Loktanella sp.]